MPTTPVYALLARPFWVYDGSNAEDLLVAATERAGTEFAVAITSDDAESMALHYVPAPGVTSGELDEVIPTGSYWQPLGGDASVVDPGTFAAQYVQVPTE
jgi:hypothetical protein